MYSGEPQSASRSTFAHFFPQDVQETRHSSVWGSVIEEVNSEDITQRRPWDESEELDQDQKLSALLSQEQANDDTSSRSFASPSPIPDSVSQTSALSSSPAALFLCAFTSPKPEPAPLPDDEGQTVAGYTFGPIIGFGSFSTIRKAYSESGGVVAIKIVRRADLVRTGHAPEERRKLQHEAEVWSSLSHEHILPLFSAVHTPQADYFITLYCPAGSLYDILKRDGQPALPQDDAGMMFRQVVRGLRYLHEVAMFVHRDIKLENVLVDESGVCKIGDFGMSVKIGDVDGDDAVWGDHYDHHHHDPVQTYDRVHRAVSLSVSTSKRTGRAGSSLNPARHHSARHRNSTSNHTSHVFQPGSLPYAAPELLLPQTSESMPPHPSQDIWALGIMLYALLTGHLPFSDSFEPRLQMKILNGAFDIPKDIGRGAEGILNGCLERSVSKRWSIDMVDEVAWSVGWGSAGDDATPEASEEDLRPQRPAPERGSRPAEIHIPEPEDDDWQQEEQVSRSAFQAASRRSSSRAKRSLSRAPLVTRTSSGRSMSRQSRPASPHRSALNTSFFYSGIGSASGTAAHSPVTTPLYEASPIGSRSSSRCRPRGRKLNKTQYFPSRSPSPSIAPTTPIDFGPQILSRMDAHNPPEDLDLDSPPRGRTKFVSIRQRADSDVGGGAADKGLSPATEMSVSSEEWSSSAFGEVYARDPRTAGASSSREKSAERPRQLQVSPQDVFVPRRRSCPGGNPPASAQAWEIQGGKNSPAHGLLSRCRSYDLLSESFSTRPGSARGMIARSRSADCGPNRAGGALEAPLTPSASAT